MGAIEGRHRVATLGTRQQLASGGVAALGSRCRPNGTAVEVYEPAEMDYALMWELFERYPRPRHSLL